MSHQPPEEIQSFARRLKAKGAETGHRRLLVLSGSREWGHELAAQVVATDDAGRVWIGDRAPGDIEPLSADRALKLLGRDLDVAVFDAHAGLHVDAFGAISGTVVGGGLMVLLAPPLPDWPAFDDPDYERLLVSGWGRDSIRGRFLQRFVRTLEDDPDAVVVREGEVWPAVPESGGKAPDDSSYLGPDDECLTVDQDRAVQAVEKAATGRARRPTVLTSDRGRGKSSALGIAAARLMRRGVGPITVTGPRFDAAEQVFRHAERCLPEARAGRASIHLDGLDMDFRPPDDLARGDDVDGVRLLLVDEAAAIPAPLLTDLLERYPRVAFATTVHGYEGTGRGFAVRFHEVLDRRTPNWRAVRLETPIRWRPGDPLERFVDRALLLDASKRADAEAADAMPESVEIERVDRDRLPDDEMLLSELFGLLVLAHYRTRPFDLRLLLDGPNIDVWVMRHRGRVVGTCLLAIEGGLDESVASRVWAGAGRPQGHLMPESLAAHSGLLEAPQRVGARIMRIAVHPGIRNRGLGTHFVERITARLGDTADYLGSSFGATARLLDFWRRCGLVPVRFGISRGAASGEHSAMVMRPLNERGRALFERARARFFEHLPEQLDDALSGLEPELVERVLLREKGNGFELRADQWEDAVAFAHGRRLPEAVIASLRALAVGVLSDPAAAGTLDDRQRRVLIVRLVQKRGWIASARALGVPGRRQVLDRMREAVAAVIAAHGGEAARRTVRRIREEF